mgnify:CR=1 FL=1
MNSKPFPGILSILLIAALVSTPLAAHAQTGPPQAAPPAAEKNTIFDYKAELKLTDEQEQQIRQILTELASEMELQGARRTIVRHELGDLLKKEADLAQIKKQLEQESALSASMTYEDIAASRRINAILTPEQLKKWRGIQEAGARGKNKDR